MSGLLKETIEMFKAFNELRHVLKDKPNKENTYASMSLKDLRALSDEEFFDAVYFRIDYKVEDFDNVEDGLATLTDTERVFYVVATYDLEINDGGLCQFFVNSSSSVAPSVSEALAAIGANEHRALFESFVSEHGIDLNNLSSFKVKKTKDYIKQTERYPFDSFDYSFGELKSLQEYLIPFAKSNLEDFNNNSD